MVSCAACVCCGVAIGAIIAVIVVTSHSYVRPLPTFPPPRDFRPGPRPVNAPANVGDTPLLLALSGGGNRALSFSTAFARSAHSAGVFEAPALKAVSANSGGAWFLSLFAYNKEFHDAVVGYKPLADILNDRWELFNTKMPTSLRRKGTWDINPPGFDEAVASPDAADLPTTSFLEDIRRIMRLRNWRAFIRKQIVGEETSAKPMDGAHRLDGMRTAELLFQTSNSTTMYVRGPHGPAPAVVLNATYLPPPLTFGATDEVPFSPLTWTVAPPSDSAPAPAGSWWVPAPSVQTAVAMGVAAKEPAFDKALEVLTGRRQGNLSPELPELVDVLPIAPFFGGRPTVVDVTASSSAAASLVSGPLSLFELLLAIIPGLFMDRVVRQAVHDRLWRFSDLGVCTSPSTGPEDHHPCRPPHVRLADGAYVDNLAVAAAVGRLQQRFPAALRLRLITVLSNKVSLPEGCTEAAVEGRCKPRALRDDLSRIFAGGRVGTEPYPRSILPGDAVQSCLIAGVSCLCPQVFDADFTTDVEAKLRPVPGARHATYAAITTTTVRNPAFGVAAGTTFDVLVVCMDAPVDVGIIAVPVVELADAETYASAAADGEVDGMADVLRSWLEDTAPEAQL